MINSVPVVNFSDRYGQNYSVAFVIWARTDDMVDVDIIFKSVINSITVNKIRSPKMPKYG